MKLSATAVGVMGMMAAITACSEDAAPVTTRNAPVAPRAEPVGEAAAAPVPHIYTYQSAGKKDPFRPYFYQDDVVRNAEGPLARYELDELKLTAVITGIATPTAMIEDPTGHGHIIHVGQAVGRDNAVVKHIRRDGIILQSDIINFNLTRTTVLLNMKLSAEPG